MTRPIAPGVRLAACVALAFAIGVGCSFDIAGITLFPTGDDLALGDLAAADLSDEDQPMFTAPDLAEDLASDVDLSGTDFSTTPFDLTGADLTPSVAGFPSHVGFHYLSDSAADWTISQNTTIDTTALTISTQVPAGVVFVVDGAYAVLAVHSLSLGTMQKPDTRVRVVGNRPLVIVAGAEIHVWGLLDAGAHADIPGAGGARPATGDGKGTTATALRAGGGGASYGTVGGGGGAAPKTPAGSAYGDAPITVFVGGSGGGAGRMGEPSVRMNCTSPAPGGAGGGALQLTARKIVIEASGADVRGTVSVGGGGGSGGCAAKSEGAGGGGGGSGGALLIESPALTLSGRLIAAGGGGGGGSSTRDPLGGQPPSYLDGLDGYDGFVPASPTLSSLGGAGLSLGGAGYNGFRSIISPSANDGGWNGLSFAHNGGGGGGGGGGRIRVRASVMQSPSATPSASVVVDLPATIP